MFVELAVGYARPEPSAVPSRQRKRRRNYSLDRARAAARCCERCTASRAHRPGSLRGRCTGEAISTHNEPQALLYTCQLQFIKGRNVRGLEYRFEAA
jgi:hypothetical protein